MQVKSIAECSEHSAILSTFITLPAVIKTFVLSNFELLFYTGFTVLKYKLLDNLLVYYDFLQIEQSASYSEPLKLRTIFSGPIFYDKNAGIEHSL